MTVFVLDTNVLADIAAPTPPAAVLAKFLYRQRDALCLCEAVDYEIRRSYLKTRAVTRLKAYEEELKPQFEWIPILNEDWNAAAQLWADTSSKGRVLSDVDLLIAAVALRLEGVVVTADNDFDSLPVTRVNWRIPDPV
jgi:predicted nucleic acid-binding protein